jgi:hypothetical protein
MDLHLTVRLVIVAIAVIYFIGPLFEQRHKG